MMCFFLSGSSRVIVKFAIVRYYEYDITAAQPRIAPGTPGNNRPRNEVASFAAGAMGNPVAADISNQANPEKQP
jgi:hypothetical protein